MTDRRPSDPGSGLLPSDPFDQALARLIGLPNGGHTAATVVQDRDFYGNTTSYMVQTVRTDQGPTAFVTQVNAAGAVRYTLPPAVLRTIDRQRDSLTAQLRRRHGQALAAKQAAQGAGFRFTPAMRAKALATRKANAARRQARKAKA